MSGGYTANIDPFVHIFIEFDFIWSPFRDTIYSTLFTLLSPIHIPTALQYIPKLNIITHLSKFNKEKNYVNILYIN